MRCRDVDRGRRYRLIRHSLARHLSLSLFLLLVNTPTTTLGEKKALPTPSSSSSLEKRPLSLRRSAEIILLRSLSTRKARDDV